MVSKEQALQRYLKEEIFPQICPPPYGEIDIRRLSADKPVFLFIERDKKLLVVGKVCKHDGIPLEKAWFSAETEYTNLKLAREKYGMGKDLYRVIEPLGEKKELAALLVTQRAGGRMLEHYITGAVYEHQRLKLFQKLGYLAGFFNKLHSNTRTEKAVSAALPQWYLNKMLGSLRRGLLGCSEIKALEQSAAPWWSKEEVSRFDNQVIVHGDATPTNFFLRKQDVTGIDLEKMRYADRCWDLGFMAAELKHHFWWRTGDRWAAEPFIGHFLWEYSVRSGDTQLFTFITGKLPLYMALGLLRIARNIWLGDSYRKALTEEARLCLEYGR